MDIIRVEKSRDYTVVHNAILRDKVASMKARGMLMTILSLTPDWDFTVAGIEAIAKESRNTIYAIIDELIELGYCTRTPRPRHKGKFTGTEYTFRESPYPKKPDTVFSAQLSTNELKVKPHDPHTHTEAYVRVGGDYVGTSEDFFANLENDEGPAEQGLLLDVAPVSRSEHEPVPEWAFKKMYKLCYQAETYEETNLLDSRQRGRVASVLGKLRDANVDLNKLDDFRVWWSSFWMGKDKVSGSYIPPRPEQINEYWTTAMKAVGISPNGNKAPTPVPNAPSMKEIEDVMKARRVSNE